MEYQQGTIGKIESVIRSYLDFYTRLFESTIETQGKTGDFFEEYLVEIKEKFPEILYRTAVVNVCKKHGKDPDNLYRSVGELTEEIGINDFFKEVVQAMENEEVRSSVIEKVKVAFCIANMYFYGFI